MKKFFISLACFLSVVNTVSIPARSANENHVLSDCNEFIQDSKKLLDLAICLSLQSNYVEAIRILDKIIAENSSDINAYYQRGFIYFKLYLLARGNNQDRYRQQAVDNFSQIIHLNPNQAKAYYYRAILSLSYQERLSDLQRTIQLKPDFAEAYYEYYFYYFIFESDRQKKLNNLNRAIYFKPDFAEAYYAKGELMYSEEKNEGLEDYTNAIRLNPNFYERLEGDNTIFLENLDLENQEYIINYLTRSIQNNAQNPEVYYSRGYYYLKLGQLNEAIADFSKTIQLNPEDTEAYYRRGFALYRLKDYQGAIDDFTQAIRLNPKFAKAFLSRSLAYYDLGNMCEAIKDATEMIQLNPVPDIRTGKTNPLTANAYFIRGRAYQELGDSKKALQDYQIAFNHWPPIGPAGGSSLQGDPERQYALGRSLAARGAKKEAIAHLQEAASLFQAQGNDRGYEKTQNLLRRLQQTQGNERSSR